MGWKWPSCELPFFAALSTKPLYSTKSLSLTFLQFQTYALEEPAYGVRFLHALHSFRPLPADDNVIDE